MMATNDALHIIEKRIAALEEQVLPKDKKADLKGRNVSDLLLQTQLMVSSALNCRDAVSKVLKRLHSINAYLDPSDGDVDVECKRQFLLEVHPEAMEILQDLVALHKLQPVLDSKSIARVPDLAPKLNELVVKNLDVHEESREVTGNVVQCLQQYHNIMTTLQLTFYEMEVALTEMELAAQPKKVVDE